MGGAANQKLTPMIEGHHKELHKDLNKFLRTKTNGAGKDMMPRRGNSSLKIQSNFTRQERVGAMKEFYNNNKIKYYHARNDFNKQHP
jgi:hypothetical protein